MGRHSPGRPTMDRPPPRVSRRESREPTELIHAAATSSSLIHLHRPGRCRPRRIGQSPHSSHLARGRSEINYRTALSSASELADLGVQHVRAALLAPISFWDLLTGRCAQGMKVLVLPAARLEGLSVGNLSLQDGDGRLLVTSASRARAP